MCVACDSLGNIFPHLLVGTMGSWSLGHFHLKIIGYNIGLTMMMMMMMMMMMIIMMMITMMMMMLGFKVQPTA